MIRRWGRFRREVRQMLTASGSQLPIDRRQIEKLPPPARRFLVKALGSRVMALRAIRLRHRGTFRARLEGEPLPIRGEEYIVASPPGFLWRGRIRARRFLWVDAYDRSLDGAGNLRIVAESMVTVGDSSGPAIDRGELLRLLGEMVLIPTALVDRCVTWEAIGDRSARAVLRVNGREVSGVFDFGEDDLPVRFSAIRDLDLGGGKSVSTPWSGEFHDYRKIEGVMVPFQLSAAWHIKDKAITYADFLVEQLELDVAKPF